MSVGASVHDDDSAISSAGESERTKDDDEVQQLARSETRAVTRARGVVFAVLLLALVLATLGVYWFTRHNEYRDFVDSFASSAHLIKFAFHNSVQAQLGAISTLGTSITSYAKATNQTFPFVLVDDFAARGAETRVAARTVALHWAPLVTDDKREAWEEYALANREQMDASFDQDAYLREKQDEEFELREDTRGLQEQNVSQPTNVLQDGSKYHPKIWNVYTKQPEPEGNGPYIVAWQRSPVNTQKQALMNLNFAQAPILIGGAVPAVLQSEEAVINRAVILSHDVGNANINANLLIGQYRHDAAGYASDPLSFIAYPVFDSLEKTNRTVAGLLVTNLYWRLHFSDILPATSKGIICELQNSFNQTLVYKIDGAKATFLGEEYDRDLSYGDLDAFTNVNEHIRDRASPETMAYNTVPLDNEFGRYTLRVYPSKETEMVFRTQNPTRYSLVVAAAFLFTSVVFVVYDLLVERRQLVVMDRAEKSGAIVSSLFPETVRERIYDASNDDGKTDDWAGNVDPEANQNSEEYPTATKRIADLFPEATVMFADLAGFTSWSANRSPEDVFELLESLYSAFDERAAARKVFKIETIGDCYVAVTGVPKPQKDHAVRMIKFAQDCIDEMRVIVHQLSTTLGRDTKDLELRVGISSGSVTAGVLRGQKSRFQLFGGTVNTTARTESLGEPGRIHVTEATASELRARGKEHWLTKREDKVQAKGIGYLQTYWVTGYHDSISPSLMSSETKKE